MCVDVQFLPRLFIPPSLRGGSLLRFLVRLYFRAGGGLRLRWMRFPGMGVLNLALGSWLASCEVGEVSF